MPSPITLAQVAALLVKQLGCDPSQVTPEATFEELGADSLDRVEIIMALEEDFGIDISAEDAERITTVKQALDYLNAD